MQDSLYWIKDNSLSDNDEQYEINVNFDFDGHTKRLQAWWPHLFMAVFQFLWMAFIWVVFNNIFQGNYVKTVYD